ncbi:MAG: hypothetical protein WAW80_00310 [Candidatus Saccharimonadales bacterium]
MSEISLDDSYPDSRKNFWEDNKTENRIDALIKIEDNTYSMKAAEIAFSELELHRKLLFNLYDCDDDLKSDAIADKLLVDCGRIALNFGTYLNEHFAETSDDSARLRLTEEVFQAIDESHLAILLTILTAGPPMPVWEGSRTTEELQALYEEVPETAFVAIIQKALATRLKRSIDQVVYEYSPEEY